MTNNTTTLNVEGKPNLEIIYNTRNVFSDPNLTLGKRQSLRENELITYLIFTLFFIVVPIMVVSFGLQWNRSLDAIVSATVVITLTFGLFGVVMMKLIYPYSKGTIWLTDTEIRFRKYSSFLSFYPVITGLKFNEIKSIHIQEKEYHIAFEKSNHSYEHLYIMGMNKSDWDVMKNRLLHIPGVKVDSI